MGHSKSGLTKQSTGRKMLTSELKRKTKILAGHASCRCRRLSLPVDQKSQTTEGDDTHYFRQEGKNTHLIRIEGYAFIFDNTSGRYIRRPEKRIRIIGLADSGNIINV
jgi:hypothetical protein